MGKIRLKWLDSVREGARSRILAAGIVSMAAFATLQFVVPRGLPPNSETMTRAAEIMEQAISAIRSHRQGIKPDPSIDPNETGLIGPEDSPLMTTLGQLEAKRSTTNPNMAGLIVRLLEEAGVRAGDTVAVGSSGSFPALLVASLAAVKAMDVHAVCILSLGASSYGATDTDFDLLDIYSVLQRSGICSEPPAAVSLGGEKDVGEDFEPEVRDALIRKITTRGIPLIYERDLVRNVVRRVQIYRDSAKGRISAFINSGGGYANLGTSALALRLKPGVNRRVEMPPREVRGVFFELASEGIPEIHLLHIKGLTQRYGLPWDPIPLPGAARDDTRPAGASFWFVCTAYFGLILWLFEPWRFRAGF